MSTMISFKSSLFALALLSATAFLGAPAAAAPLRQDGFLDQVRESFSAWDSDHDGTLSADEIERALDDPAVKGPAAAAAASLRRAIRANPQISPVTIDRLAAAVNDPASANVKPPRYQAMFDTALRRITAAKRDLFVSGLPRVQTLGQGRLGDCFLLAALGTFADAQPEHLKKMVTERGDGKVAVHFGDGEDVIVDLPTDGEIAIGAGTLNDGLWANVFEKAIGTLYLARQKTHRHVTPYDIIGVGGTPSSPLSILTGHACKKLHCADFQKGQLSSADREAKLAEMRQELAAAFKSGRLVVSGTAGLGGGETIVRGLYYNHSYGVLAYNAAIDVVTFWNPMGNHFVPAGDPGLVNGYATSHGRFDVPLAEAVMWLGAFSIETDQPAGK
jgi:hypothetical protein